MTDNAKQGFSARVEEAKRHHAKKGWRSALTLPLAIVLTVTSLSHIGVRLGILQDPNSNNPQKEALLPYEAPTLASIGAMLIGGVISDAHAVACHPSVSTC